MQDDYQQLHLFATEDHLPPTPQATVPMESDNHISGLLSRTASQFEAMQLDHVRRMTEAQFQRIQEESR